MENGCTFCLNLETGDDYFPIVSQELDFGAMGIMYVDAVLEKPDNPSLAVSCCFQCGDHSFEKLTPINYCPMCGKELRKHVVG